MHGILLATPSSRLQPKGKTSNDQHSRPSVVNHAGLGENLYHWEVHANLGKSIQGY